MGLLDEEDELRYTPPKHQKGERYDRYTAISQEMRDKELNDLGLKKSKKDFSDSPHL